MGNILLLAPVAFLIYILLAFLLKSFGKLLAGPEKPSEAKSSLYASGENLVDISGAPGYKPFFLIALFFAILHLGVLMLGSSDLNGVAGIYLIGLLLALTALILG